VLIRGEVALGVVLTGAEAPRSPSPRRRTWP